jgi:glycosyltransferase involved in cell wall biosynthesis
MNILFISTLYPSQPLESNEPITLALHNLVKRWNQAEDVNILVIRPVFLYLREIFKKKMFFRKKMLTIDHVRIIVYPIFKIPKIAYFYYPLIRFLKSSDFIPHLVIAHFDKSLTIGYKFAKARRLPLIAGLHISIDLSIENPGPFTKRCKKVLDFATAVACRSTVIFRRVSGWFPGYKQKSFVAFSGIEKEIISDENLSLKKFRNRGKSQLIRFITVSSLIERKKIADILNALALLDKKIRWTYIIAGEGDERKNLELLAHALGIADRVEFTGQVSRAAAIELMKKSHIFLLLSKYETFGLVYLEAMAAGNIVIGSKNEGIDGIIQHLENGFLCEPGNINEIKQTIEHILHLPGREIETLVKKAFAVVRNYTEEQAAENYLRHIKKVYEKNNNHFFH